MIDRAGVQQLTQGLVVDVGERVVAHQPLGDDPVVEEPVQCAACERGDGGGLLVVVDLWVGQPAAVIDDRVHVLPADASGAFAAIAGQRVPRLGELAELLDVHVQQVPGTRPLVADDRWALGWLGARAASTPQHLMHSRVRASDLHSDRPGTPAGPLAQLTDPFFLLARNPGGRAAWTAGALRESGAVSYTHLRAHETVLDLVCRLLLEKKNT